MSYPAIRNSDRPPVRPGEILADILLDIDKPKIEIARLLGISRQHLYDVVNGDKAVSADLAARLGKLFGGGAGLWLRAQANYEAWEADRTVDVSAIPRLIDA